MPYHDEQELRRNIEGQYYERLQRTRQQRTEAQAFQDMLLYGQANVQAQWNYGAGMANAAQQLNAIPAGWQRYGAMPAAPVQQPVPEPLPVIPEIPDIVEDPNMKLLNTFLVGCDPEFIAVQDPLPVHMNVHGFIPQKGQVGWDHNGKVIEIRPTPAKSAHTLVKKIATLFRTTKFPTKKLRAGAYFDDLSLGGHVHLDVMDNHGTRVLALDKFTMLLEKLDILPTRECLARRNKQYPAVWNPDFKGYGKYSDYKLEHGRIEYRTMPSWLYSPITSFLCLTGAKLACAEPVAAIAELDRGKVSTGKLIRFFEKFDVDADARRVVEKLLEPGEKLQRDPDSNLLEVWGTDSKDLRLLDAA